MGEKTTSCVDMISELPDFILHQILSLLPTKAAAKTCVLSKRWCHIWGTFPNMDCCQFFFGKYLDVLNPNELGLPKDVRRSIYDQRVEFMSYVDEKLRRIFENDLCLKKFRLSMALVSVGLFPRVDSWLDLVSRLDVEELELRLTLGKKRFYHLPTRILALKSLRILNLKDSILIDCLCRDDLKLSSLVELHLYSCFISEEAILDLISSIKSMEVLSLKHCSGFTKLTLHGHEKLKKVVYHPNIDLKNKKFSINLLNLEEFDLMISHRRKSKRAFTCDSVCPNLKRLSLCGVFIDAKSLQDVFSSFPLLEYFCLGGCIVKQDVKLSSSVLKEVYLRNCVNTDKVEFDTPGLRVFRYYGDEMYQVSLNNDAFTRIAEISGSLRKMDSSWFMKWNNFLMVNRFLEVTIYIDAAQGHEIPFTTENLALQPLELKSMKLAINAFTTVNYAALLDGIFSNFHPKTLRLELNHSSPKHVQGLLNNLVVGAEPTSCQDENINCWRYSLKAINFEKVKGFQAGTPLDSITLNSLNEYLDKWATEAQRTLDSYETVQHEILSFDLSW